MTTVTELHATLTAMIVAGKGGQELWIDPPPSAGDDATLYAGDDEDEPEVLVGIGGWSGDERAAAARARLLELLDPADLAPSNLAALVLAHAVLAVDDSIIDLREDLARVVALDAEQYRP